MLQISGSPPSQPWTLGPRGSAAPSRNSDSNNNNTHAPRLCDDVLVSRNDAPTRVNPGRLGARGVVLSARPRRIPNRPEPAAAAAIIPPGLPCVRSGDAPALGLVTTGFRGAGRRGDERGKTKRTRDESAGPLEIFGERETPRVFTTVGNCAAASGLNRVTNTTTVQRRHLISGPYI